MVTTLLGTKARKVSLAFSLAVLLLTSCSPDNTGAASATPSLQIDQGAGASRGEYDASELTLLSTVPDRDIHLYSTNTDGVILAIGDAQYYYPWTYMTPRGIVPRMQVADYDGDGEEELSVVLYMGSGTGVSVEELHIIELSEKQALPAQESDRPSREILTDRVFSASDYISQLKRAVGFTISEQPEALQGELTVGGKTYLLSLKDFESEDYGKINDNIIWGNIVSFSSENNQLKAEFGVGINFEKFVSPVYMGHLSSDVDYTAGEFVLNNFRFEKLPEQ